MEVRACPACGEPVEERFRLCPQCGVDLSAKHTPIGGPVELIREAIGLDERALPTMAQLFRDPGCIAADASSHSSRFTRPVRLYLMISLLAMATYAVLGRVMDPPPRPPRVANPDELSLSLELAGPSLLVGDRVLAAIEDAGGVDEWIAREGRLDRQPPWMRFFARRALQLRSEGRLDDVRSGFAQNRGMLSLLLIPLFSVCLAGLYFRRATFRGHFDLAAVLISVALLLDLGRQFLGIALAAGVRFLALIGIPLRPDQMGGWLVAGLFAAHAAAYLWYIGRSTRSFYGLATAHAVVLAPLTFIAAFLGYLMVAFTANVVFILLG